MLVTHSMCGSGFFSIARRLACIFSRCAGVRICAFSMWRIAQVKKPPAPQAGPTRTSPWRVARRLQVVEDLLVNLAEMLAIDERVEIDAVDLVDDLPHQLAGFHVIVGVLENCAHDAPSVAGLARNSERL